MAGMSLVLDKKYKKILDKKAEQARVSMPRFFELISLSLDTKNLGLFESLAHGNFEAGLMQAIEQKRVTPKKRPVGRPRKTTRGRKAS